MILQALKTYYHRTAASDDGVATEGFQQQDIPFLIILNRKGEFVDIHDTRLGEGKKKVGRSFFVPKAVKKTSGIAANLLWDVPAYIVGRPKPNPKKKDQVKLVERADEQQSTFLNRIKETFGNTDDDGIRAVIQFLEKRDFEALFNRNAWQEIEDAGSILSFMLEGDTCLICERQAVVRLLRQSPGGDGEKKNICLMTGEQDNPVRLHTAIKGVWGAQTSGANIVSFNLKAFTSFGKEQGFNAPVGQRAEFAYTTALNLLLKKGSRQRLQVGDASTVFWADKKHDLEDVFADIFGEPAKDNSVQDYKALVALFRAPQLGAKAELDPVTRFYVLGLAPNAARIAVRFWYEGTVAQISNNIYQHFEDCTIVHGPNQPETLSLFRLLVSTATQGKSESIQPNLAGDFMRAIITGTPYPKTLLSAAVRRIRAEREITYPRAALVKAVLSRESRYFKYNTKEVGMALDTSNDNIGYRMGRLFATLEKIQEEASPGINATIRDRFYGAASSTPVAVFSHLMKLKNHHLSKLENRGRAVNFERLIAEIVDDINDFPPHLSLADQGRFAVGYYHQRQDFFSKKEQ